MMHLVNFRKKWITLLYRNNNFCAHMHAPMSNDNYSLKLWTNVELSMFYSSWWEKRWHTDKSLENFSTIVASVFFSTLTWKPDRLRNRVAGFQFWESSNCEMCKDNTSLEKHCHKLRKSLKDDILVHTHSQIHMNS